MNRCRLSRSFAFLELTTRQAGEETPGQLCRDRVPLRFVEVERLSRRACCLVAVAQRREHFRGSDGCVSRHRDVLREVRPRC